MMTLVSKEILLEYLIWCGFKIINTDGEGVNLKLDKDDLTITPFVFDPSIEDHGYPEFIQYKEYESIEISLYDTQYYVKYNTSGLAFSANYNPPGDIDFVPIHHKKVRNAINVYNRDKKLNQLLP